MKLPRPSDFKSLSLIRGHRPILLDLNVAVANMPNECNFIKSGSVENQLSKYTRNFYVWGVLRKDVKQILFRHI